MENMLVVTLVLCAFCFYIGYAVGSDRTTDKMLKKNLSLTDRLNDALAKNETLQKKVSELENQLEVAEDNTIKQEVSIKSEPLKEQESSKNVHQSLLPPESDYDRWFSVIFDSSALYAHENTKNNSGKELIDLCVLFFNVGLFVVMLTTENHDFERYCFRRLKNILDEGSIPSLYTTYTDHYNRIIDVFNQCIREEVDSGLYFKAIAESSVDYFYKKGDDLSHSYQVTEALCRYMFSTVLTFKDSYPTK